MPCTRWSRSSLRSEQGLGLDDLVSTRWARRSRGPDARLRGRCEVDHEIHRRGDELGEPRRDVLTGQSAMGACTHAAVAMERFDGLAAFGQTAAGRRSRTPCDGESHPATSTIPRAWGSRPHAPARRRRSTVLSASRHEVVARSCVDGYRSPRSSWWRGWPGQAYPPVCTSDLGGPKRQSARSRRQVACRSSSGRNTLARAGVPRRRSTSAPPCRSKSAARSVPPRAPARALHPHHHRDPSFAVNRDLDRGPTPARPDVAVAIFAAAPTVFRRHCTARTSPSATSRRSSSVTWGGHPPRLRGTGGSAATPGFCWTPGSTPPLVWTVFSACRRSLTRG